jgi:YegS/Rv2252/BmrU family lipid kinase
MDEPWQLIWNPTAGIGRARRLRSRVEACLAAGGIPFEFYRTEAAGHASEIAAARHAAGRRRFLIGGGDGTINEVVNGLFADGLTPEPPILGALPLGTGNDWLRSSGLPGDLEEMIGLLKRGSTRPVGLGLACASGAQTPWRRYFVNTAGIGLDVRVLESLPDWRPAVLRYAFGLFKAFATYPVPRVRFECDGQKHECEPLTVICGFGRYSGGGMCLTPHAEAAPGRLAVTLVDDLPWWRLLISFRRIYDGTIGERPEVHFMHANRVEFTEPPGALFETDGEIVGPIPATIVTCPNALTAIAAPDGDAS